MTQAARGRPTATATPNRSPNVNSGHHSGQSNARTATRTKRTFRRGSSPVISVLTELTETTETTETTGRDQGKRKPPLRGGCAKIRVPRAHIPRCCPYPLCTLCPIFEAGSSLAPVTERDRRWRGFPVAVRESVRPLRRLRRLRRLAFVQVSSSCLSRLSYLSYLITFTEMTEMTAEKCL